MSPEDLVCEQQFQETYTHDSSGRYAVDLPFKSVNPTFPGLFSIAKQTFLRMERKLRYNSKLRECYHAFMQEYIEISHMSEIGSEDSISQAELDRSYFIPHHGIFQGGSSNPKFRVVFNASAHSTNGKSLNEVLFSGPPLQTNIIDVLIY